MYYGAWAIAEGVLEIFHQASSLRKAKWLLKGIIKKITEGRGKMVYSVREYKSQAVEKEMEYSDSLHCRRDILWEGVN